MIVRLTRLRLARLLALLAVLLMTGLGQHLHAADMPAGAVAMVSADKAGDAGEDDPGQALPSAAHCGFCHAVRGMMPAPAGVCGPVVTTVAAALPAHDLAADLAAPDEPSRPPRPRHAAA